MTTDCPERLEDGERCQLPAGHGGAHQGPNEEEEERPREEIIKHGDPKLGESGYQDCACRDCFELVVAHPGAFCEGCIEAGCPDYQGQEGMSQECQAPHAYCDGGEVTGEDGKAYCEQCGQPF